MQLRGVPLDRKADRFPCPDGGLEARLHACCLELDFGNPQGRWSSIPDRKGVTHDRAMSDIAEIVGRLTEYGRIGALNGARGLRGERSRECESEGGLEK